MKNPGIILRCMQMLRTQQFFLESCHCKIILMMIGSFLVFRHVSTSQQVWFAPFKMALKLFLPPHNHPSYLAQTLRSSLPRLPGKPLNSCTNLHAATSWIFSLLLQLLPSLLPFLSLFISLLWNFNHSFIAGSRIELISNPHKIIRVKGMWVWLLYAFLDSHH